MESENKNIDKKNKLNISDFFFEVLGWIQIVFSPLLFAAIIGFLIYISNPTTTRLILAIAITVAGLILGIIWANKIWKGKGTIHFVSRVNASPELDHLNEENKINSTS